jgi:hypothetical protein
MSSVGQQTGINKDNNIRQLKRGEIISERNS